MKYEFYGVTLNIPLHIYLDYTDKELESYCLMLLDMKDYSDDPIFPVDDENNTED